MYVTPTGYDNIYMTCFNYPRIIVVSFTMISQKSFFIKNLKSSLAKRLIEMIFIKKKGQY